jgi:hypothetical protein
MSIVPVNLRGEDTLGEEDAARRARAAGLDVPPAWTS